MKTATCPATIDTLTEKYVSEKMSEPSQQRFEHHVMTCRSCWERLQFTRQIVRDTHCSTEWLRRRTYPRTMQNIPTAAAPAKRTARRLALVASAKQRQSAR